MRTAILTVAICVFLVVVAGTAAASPLVETEPNDTPLTANGPINGEGFQTTLSTKNDFDYAWVNLKAQQQVTLSIASLTPSCNNNFFYNGGVNVEARDWLGRSRLKNFIYGNGPTETWTTPEVPVRLNIGYFVADVGCTLLFKVQPATAISNDPLPPLPPRDLSVTATSSLITDSNAKVTVSGDAYEGDRVTARLKSLSDGTCPAASDAPDDVTDFPAFWTDALTTGPFSSKVTVEVPSQPGGYNLCAWATNPDDAILSLVGSSKVKVVPRGHASVAKKSVRKGSALRADVLNVKGFVTFLFSRKGKVVATLTGRVFHGRTSVSTKSLPTGTLRLKIVSGDQTLAKTTVRITK